MQLDVPKNRRLHVAPICLSSWIKLENTDIKKKDDNNVVVISSDNLEKMLSDLVDRKLQESLYVRGKSLLSMESNQFQSYDIEENLSERQK